MSQTASTVTASGTFIHCTLNYRLYKTRNDLNLYKSAALESTFIEIINHKKSNILVGSIYRHPAIDLKDFNGNYLNEHKLSSENKSVIPLGDFNVDIMNYDNHHSTNIFLDYLSSNLFLPQLHSHLEPEILEKH